MRVLILYFILFSFPSFAVKIQVVDAETKIPVPYVTYVHIKDSKGSFADENGLIEINYKVDEPYSLSCVGYISVSIIPSESQNTIYLKANSKELAAIVVYGKGEKKKAYQIGQIKKNSFTPYYTNLPRLTTMLNYLPSINKEKNWSIKSIKLGIGGNSSKVYKSYLIRLLIKEEVKGLPGKDLLTKDWVVEIDANSLGYEFELEESIIMPKNGCFVGFETVGKIKKDGSFVPFTEFYEKPERPFQFVIRMIKSDGLSLMKRGSINAWFDMKDPDNKPDTYAIAIDVVEVD